VVATTMANRLGRRTLASVTPASHRLPHLGLAALVALVAALALAAPAGAAISVVSGGEPAYTKGTTNTWWFGWNDPGSTSADPYLVCFVLSKDGVAQNGHDTNCFQPTGADTVNGANTSGVIKHQVSGLLSGHQYVLTANDFYDQCGPGCGIRADGAIEQSGTTTIDTSAPADSVTVDGPNTFTNDPTFVAHIDYADSISPPFPGAGGGATVDCTQLTTPCGSGSYDPGCSHAGNGRGLTNSFDCLLTWNGGDGKIWYCADEADSALPDNPSSTDQFTENNSQFANHSGFGCGYITLDRTAPAVSASADGHPSLSVTQGTAVTFAASASDSGAGPDGAYAWSFGDNTAGGAGAGVTHTYTQPGTFVATVTTHDNAKTIHSTSAPYYAQGTGNAGSASVAVTVNPPSAGGGTGGGGSAGTGGSSGGSVTSPLGSNTISKLSGGGGTRHTTVGALSVLAPKSFRLAKKGRSRLPLALTAGAAGSVTVALVRRGRVLAHGRVKITRPGTFGFKLKLPRRVSTGTASLKVTFLARGASHARVKTLRLKILKPKRHR
jgi:hypothetical protein